MRSLQDFLSHVVGAPKDRGSNGSVELASLLVLAGDEVCVGGLDVLPDRDTVEDNVVHGVNDELLGVEEGVAHGLELGDVVGADLLAVLHSGSNLGDELAELVDAGGNLVEGASLEVFDSGFHVGDERVNILDASLKAVNVLGLEGANEDTIDKLDNLKSRDSGIVIIRCIITSGVIFLRAPVATARTIVRASIAPVAIGVV